jgi:Na+/melibiose symporter-like transporter
VPSGTRPPLGFVRKLTYGLAALAQGAAQGGFETFSFFYYTQVLGLSGTLAGAAVMVALVFDGLTDPLAGSLSDATRTRWGRRHPYLYASALPLGASFALLFSPPAGLGSLGLFAWLTSFAVLLRAAITLMHVPHMALGAELSADYHERTGIVAYRMLFQTLGWSGTPLLGFWVFFRSTAEFPQGQMNAAAYPTFGLAIGGMAIAAVLVSALSTHSLIPFLPAPHKAAKRAVWRRLVADLRGVLGLSSFRWLLIGLVLVFMARGIQQLLRLHMNTYFWELDTVEMGALLLPSLVGLALGIPFWSRVSRRIEKKPTLIAGVLTFNTISVLAPSLRLLGAFPVNHDPWLLPSLLVLGFLGTFGAGGLVIVGSMVADVTDEHALRTGQRSEGVFFGAYSLADKGAAGLGHLLAGIGLDLIGFPVAGDAVRSVSPENVRDLGLLFAPGVFVLGLLAAFALSRYRLTAEQHARIRVALENDPERSG